MSSAISRDRFVISGRPEGRLTVIGLIVTLGVHLALAAAMVIPALFSKSCSAAPAPEKFQVFEAGLAMKQRTTEGKKAALPAKEVQAPVKPPDAPAIAKNPDVIPPPTPPPPEKKKDIPPPEAQNPKSTFDKFRHVDTGETTGQKSTDESEPARVGERQRVRHPGG